MSDEVCHANILGGYPCGRQVHRDEKCIFHLESKSDEEAEIFEKEFQKELEKMEEDNSIEALDFIGFIFPTAMYFKDHSFEKTICFSGCIFNNKADFSGCIFNNKANFSKCKFKNEAKFLGCKFNNEVKFNWTTFNDVANFIEVKFNNMAHFHRAVFNEITSFQQVEFNNVADFTETKFIKAETLFLEAIFNDEADFTGAEFNDQAYFLKAKFNNSAHFMAKFNHIADFSEAEFNKKANFSEAEFNNGNNEITKFQEAEFNSMADFSKAKFNNVANFSNAEFRDRADFIGTEFPTDNEKLVFFCFVRFHNQKAVKFQKVNLKNVSFLNTNITEVDFLDAEWLKKGHRFIVGDEKRIGKFEGVTYGAVTQLYRRLRLNYETNYRYAEAGDFFIGEMEMRRHDVDVDKRRFKHEKVKKVILWLKRNLSVLSIYKHLSLYGESYTHPAILAFIVIILYPIINNLVFHWIFNTPLPNYTKDFLSTYPIRDSLASFFQLENTYIGERLIAIPILGSLFIALKRKFERKG